MTRRVLLVAGLAWVILGCGHKGGGDEEEGGGPNPTVPVAVARIEERNLGEVVRATGEWRIADSLTVFAPFKAYVEALRPHAGDVIVGGETIGTLVTFESKAAVRGAEILVRQAQSPAERDEAARALRLAERDQVRVPLVASASGTVLRRSVEPGSEAAEGGELLTIAPQGSVVFEAHVPRTDAPRVAPGQQAQVSMEAGGAVTATVQRRLPQASEGDQTALFWLSPTSRAPSGVLGRFGNVTIETGAAHRAILVSDSALVEDDLTGEVRVARVAPGNVAIWTTVRLGQGQEGQHEILEPELSPGTLVVVRGQRGLPDSARVEIQR